jgi:hypothetical protein
MTGYAVVGRTELQSPDLPLVLSKLGYGEYEWGPGSTSFNTYDELVAGWPESNPPLSGESDFNSTWETIEAGQQATEYKQQRGISGYAEINSQLDMLYWDVYSGSFGDEAKSSTWFQHCSGVKEQFPKP